MCNLHVLYIAGKVLSMFDQLQVKHWPAFSRTSELSSLYNITNRLFLNVWLTKQLKVARFGNFCEYLIGKKQESQVCLAVRL